MAPRGVDAYAASMTRHPSLPFAAVAAVLLAAIVLMPPRSLAVTAAASEQRVGEFVWHDLVTTNPAASRAFYAELFGWSFAPGQGIDPGYHIIKHEERPIGGIVQPRQENAAAAQWLAYVVVADVDRAAKSFEQAGGRIHRGPLNARKGLRVAVVADPQGAALGLASRGPDFQDGEGAPGDRPEAGGVPGLHHWLWMEYVAHDPAAALTFYGTAVGFRAEVHETRNAFTYYLLTTDKPRAGLFESLWDRERSAWLPYVRVADPTAMAARAVALGGTMVLAPHAAIRNGSLAIVLDPGGAPLALQKYPFDVGGKP
jgi:predicted enzyme related to lactoylglutathione lyase